MDRALHALLVLSVMLVVLWSQTVSARSLPDFTDLVEENSGAVVNISTTTEPKAGNTGYGLLFDERQLDQMPEFFRHFFRGPQSPFAAPDTVQPRHSIGSGFIVSSDGYVLTNNHVVEGADEIVVRLSDRRELPATLVGTDPRSDVAVLKIKGDNKLPVVRIGKSKELKVGEWVFAIASSGNRVTW